jgi:ribonuclease J
MNEYSLRFISLGGIIGVTKNMYVYELYRGSELQEILIIDCGIGFPEDKDLGVDYIIPDISYLKDKRNKIVGVLLSHGHEDHISALPYYYKDLGEPEVYSGKLTCAFVRNQFREFGLNIKINEVDFNKTYSIGSFNVDFIRLTHSIPDTLHIFIQTLAGNIYHGTDFKLDLTPPYGKPPDFKKISEMSGKGTLCLLSDCLGSETPGLTLSESAISTSFDEEMKNTRGKFIMTTFSSNISRIRQCIEIAQKYQRKTVFLGRSMIENTKTAKDIGYLPFHSNIFLQEKDIKRYSPNKLCLIAAGSQGQYNSALMKLATDQNENTKIYKGDKVVFSSDPIPGNEKEVYSLIEILMIKGADVIYPDIKEQLHASGHGNQEDLKYLMRLVSSKYVIPIGGTIRHQKQYLKLGQSLGYKSEDIVLLNEGQSVVFENGKIRRGSSIDTKNIYVDAYGIGDVGRIVLRDRKTLSTEGMVVLFAVIDNNKSLIVKPRIISRGFIFEKTSEKLISEAEDIILKCFSEEINKIKDINLIKKYLTERLEEFFFTKTGRKPIVITDIIQL